MPPEQRLRLRDGRVLAYFVTGDPNGFPVVHSHGAPSGKLEIRFFDLDLRAAEAGICLISFDRPGIGGSDQRPGRTLLDWGRDVANAMEMLAFPRYGLLGYSVGAASALACREEAADRVAATAIVSGIGPADVSGITDNRSSEVGRVFDMSLKHPHITAGVLRFMRYGTRTPERMIAATGKGMPPADREVAERPGAAAPFAAFLADAMRQGTRGVRDDMRLAAMPWGFTPGPSSSPLAVWHGTADTNAPFAAARWLAATVPQTELHLSEGDGHISLLDREAGAILGRLAELMSRPG